MNSKNLIISFVTLSIASLAVSCLAVIAVARTYSSALASESRAESASVREQTREPAETDASKPIDTNASRPAETEEGTQGAISDTAETDGAVGAEGSSTAALTEAAKTEPAYMLYFAYDRLVIKAPSGETIYERLIDGSSLLPKELEALKAGISFSDKSTAMLAVYDLIS